MRMVHIFLAGSADWSRKGAFLARPLLVVRLSAGLQNKRVQYQTLEFKYVIWCLVFLYNKNVTK